MKSLGSIDAEVALRALAIAAVVFNHAHVYGGQTDRFTGGMTVLMLLSGFSFARFVLRGRSRQQVLKGLGKLGWALLAPSVLLVLLSFAIKGVFAWAELAMISNWTSGSYVSFFPVWYPQVILQMFLGLGIAVAIPGIWERFCSAPLMGSLALFCLALAVRAFAPQLWDTTALHHRLPHLLLWNFTLGWVLFFARGHDLGPLGRLAFFFCAAVGSSLGWPLMSPQPYWLTLAAALIIWAPRWRLPRVMARVLSVVSQAAFAIFLLHGVALGAYRAWLPWRSPTAAFVFALVGCVLTWLVATAAWRAWRHLRRASKAPTISCATVMTAR